MFSALLFHFPATHRTCLSSGILTLDHITFDGLDGHYFQSVLVPALIDLSELTISDFFLQNVLVDYFGHLSNSSNIL